MCIKELITQLREKMAKKFSDKWELWSNHDSCWKYDGIDKYVIRLSMN